MNGIFKKKIFHTLKYLFLCYNLYERYKGDLMKTICVGHSTFDITLPMDKFPTENIKYRIEKRIECGGGPASNGAYLLARWGAETTICSVVGDDYYGNLVIEDFKRIGANCKYLEKLEGHNTSSSYIIANMSNGSRTIITSKRCPIRKLKQEVNEEADVILIDGEHPDTAYEVLKKNPNAISVLDAGRLNDDTRMLGKMVTYVVCSHDFAEEFTNRKTDINDFDALINIYNELKDYFKTNIVITLEENGSFTEINGDYRIIPSLHAHALDSTGAGDIFHGAFTYFVGKHYSLYDSIKYASITGAISVTRIGSRYSIPSLDEVLNYDSIL